ncbi:MAG: hypothetical protein C0453_06785 [Comamonadaceae bacterium]|nr:hypothetical protein [Comamonadaceae bacterium]
MPADIFTSLAASALLALVHLGVSGLHHLRKRPRRFWLSMGSGTAVAYVFLHLLPELQQHQGELEQASEAVLGWLERHVYLLALLGLAVFYGLERLSLRERRALVREPPGRTLETVPGKSRSTWADKGSGERTSGTTFWLSMTGFTVYNALIGHLLVEQARRGMGPLILLTAAMALHFLVNDHALREHHQLRYHHTGRWVLSAAVLLGTGAGLVGAVPSLAVSLLVAFLAGGVVLNVLKEELPAANESSFGAFLLGMVAYATLLLLI